MIAAVRWGIHPPGRIRRLLACETLEEQRQLYERDWNTRRWRLLFTVLLNRAVFRKTYHPAFFEHVENPSFARHFRMLAEHALTQVPVSTNYFVHHMFTGSYPRGVPGGLPPYLDPERSAVVTPALDRLTLVDGGYTTYLRTRPDAGSTGSRSPTSWSGPPRSRPTSCSPRSSAPRLPAPAWCSGTSSAGPRCRTGGGTRWWRTEPGARP